MANVIDSGVPPNDAILAFEGRKFSSDIPGSVLDAIQAGVMRTKYRDVPFYKSPFDVVLYLQLFSTLMPRTVIEIGTKHGGSALWFADQQTTHQIKGARVVSVDITPMAAFQDQRIDFVQGDAKALQHALTPELLAACAHPWLIVEDTSHHYNESFAALTFFHNYLSQGDYIVVEDGVVSQLSDAHYRTYEEGPNRAVSDFLQLYPGAYEIDVTLCDHFGRNVTYNPNGWLRRL
jgi:cephalosporin hydroxylase